MPLQPSPVQHLAIIMDGNGRWAKQHHRPRTFGHHQGAKSVREAIQGAQDCGIKYLTLYSFSTENWRRPADEVQDLMNLLRRYLKSEIAELHEKNIRMQVIGERSKLSADINEMITHAEALTADNTALTLTLALNYGSRQEIVGAAKAMLAAVQQGQLRIEDMTCDTLGNYLETRGMPDPEIILRTSGEQRLSNFLLWQSAYSELMYTSVLWPDFKAADVHKAVNDFQNRERRFGGVGQHGR